MNALTLLELPPREWNNVFEKLSMTERREMLDQVSAFVQKAARLYGYADQRYGHGAGDQGHFDAVNESNKIVREVRKVMGFTYPKADLDF